MMRFLSKAIVVMLLCLLLPAVESIAGGQHQDKRARMVEKDIKGRGITDARVIEAMRKIPRERFVPGYYAGVAYADQPLPIGEGQTISQPYVAALMTEALALKPTDKVLEIGTGSGYQAAVLAEIVDKVYTIEIRHSLALRSARLLNDLGYKNIKTKHADGYWGWPENAPFDAIIITAAVNHIPPPLLKQIKDGGRLVLPLGSTTYYQVITLATKEGEDLKLRQMGPVNFVPMTGEAEKKK